MLAHSGVQNLRRSANSSLSMSPARKAVLENVADVAAPPRRWGIILDFCVKLSAHPATGLAIPISAVHMPGAASNSVAGMPTGAGKDSWKRLPEEDLSELHRSMQAVLGERGPNLSRAKNVLGQCPLWVKSGFSSSALSQAVRRVIAQGGQFR